MTQGADARMTLAGDLAPVYQPRLQPQVRRLVLRGLSCQVRQWGAAEASVMVLLHGARDVSASFQFVVDALRGAWCVVAPDWRGHGGSDWTPGSYWQAELMADLDALLDVVAPDRAVVLVGHSMGGNVASLYAGMAPHRVTRLVMLDALGDLLHRLPVKVDEILRLVLQTRHTPAAGAGYAGLADLADRLRRHNPRLAAGRAHYLAGAMARALPDGRFAWARDPNFRRSLPSLHTVEDWGVVWRAITAPVLAIRSADPRPNAPTSDPAEAARREAFFRDLTRITLAETGHNLHHDAPEAVAHAIEAFAAAPHDAPRLPR